MRYEDNRMLVMFRLDALKKKQIHYKVGYSFGLEDNSWYVEFYSQDEKRFEVDSPEFLRNRFKELNKNMKTYRFYKQCDGCSRYNYSSDGFQLDYQTQNIGELEISTEYFGLSLPTGNGFKIYKLLNSYTENKSVLSYCRGPSETQARWDMGFVGPNTNYLETSVIKFSSAKETTERIGKLIIFT